MKIEVFPAERETILPLRDLYRQELGCQIVHDNSHARDKCVEWHVIHLEGDLAAYGAFWIGPYWLKKGTLFEYFVLPAHRPATYPTFEKLLAAIKPIQIHTQTNDPFLGVLIYDFVAKIEVGHILFEDHLLTNHSAEGLKFRRARPEDKDRIFEHKVQGVGDWVLEFDGQVVATGDVLYHYNPPYGDIFMEVHPDFRRRGFGTYLVQELKAECRRTGRVPAARTKPVNIASRRTLERAGFAPCARLIWGDVAAGKIKS